MDPLLSAVTTLFDLVALAAALSLGLTIVTRSQVSWPAALTLWCIALFFFHNALAINMPGSALSQGFPIPRTGRRKSACSNFHAGIEALAGSQRQIRLEPRLHPAE